MKALQASICVTALALSLSLVVPCYAGEADAAAPGVEKAGPDVLREAFASRLELQSKELYQAESTRQRFRWPSSCWPFARRSLVPTIRWSRCR